MAYELGKPATQAKGTNQCWWLSFLEILRAAGRLDALFAAGGLFAGAAVPAADKTHVNGPEWQRVIMGHLRSASGASKWHGPTDTVATSSRKTELERLVGILGLANVTVGTPSMLIPSSLQTKFNALVAGDRLQVDKPNHAMAGLVVNRQAQAAAGVMKTRKVIEVYNQALGKKADFFPQGSGATLKLMSESGATTLNQLLLVQT